MTRRNAPPPDYVIDQVGDDIDQDRKRNAERRAQIETTADRIGMLFILILGGLIGYVIGTAARIGGAL